MEFSFSIIEKICLDLKLAKEFAICKSMVSVCTKIRNQYSHCNFADNPGGGRSGIFFADPEQSYFDGDFFHLFRHLSVPLLQQQLNYFGCAREWLDYLNHEIALKQGRLESHFWPRPPELSLPPMHNPPEKHIPPWLREDQKAQFLEHILAEKTGAPRPTPAQRAQEKARAEKRARQEAQRQKSREGEAQAKKRRPVP